MRTRTKPIPQALIVADLIISILVTAAPTCLRAQIAVNEVMANVRGSESVFGPYNEYIELLNCSGEPVDLSGWSVSDGDAVDAIVPWSESLGVLEGDVIYNTHVVGPNAYSLILDRDYARAPDSAGYMPYEIAPGTVVLTTANSSIGNGLSATDPIVLFSGQGDTIDTYGTPWDDLDSLPFDPGDGVSVERVFPTASDKVPNWSGCILEPGCTPGYQNSVTPYTGVGLSWEDIRFDPENPEPCRALEVMVTLHNRSPEAARNISVTLYADEDGDARPDKEEHIGTALVERIDPFGGVTEIRSRWESVPAGCHRIGVQVMDTVYAFRILRSGNGPGPVVVNEIMYDPSASGEWVEIHNWSPHELSLRGWKLKDETRACIIAGRDVKLGSGQFAIICDDTSAFLSTYPLFEGRLLEPEGFPSLNNTGDSLVLSDISGFIMDCLYYQQEWGGGGGVSLERMSPTQVSDERRNWSGCVDMAGATPGQENSIHTEIKPVRGTIDLSPNPFSPNGDGYDDYTAISYELPFAVAWFRVIVYDRQGRKVCEILPGQQVASSGALLWDGRNDSGESLPMGVYVVYAEAKDLMAQTRMCLSSTVVLARRLD